MLKLFLGMVLFFGVHSLSVVALPLRERLAARSEWGWKGIYSLVSLVGLVLIALGLGVYTLFVFWLHQRWFGVDPLIAL